MENNKYRNTNDINDAEYRQMRKSEDSSYEYHGADAEDIDEANANNGYPEVVEHNSATSICVYPSRIRACRITAATVKSASSIPRSFPSLCYIAIEYGRSQDTKTVLQYIVLLLAIVFIINFRIDTQPVVLIEENLSIFLCYDLAQPVS